VEKHTPGNVQEIFYLRCGSAPRSFPTRHGHVAKMHGAFKKALRNSSLLHGASKFPKSTSLLLQVMRYLSVQNSLVRLLISCKKKYIPKSWWSADIVSMSLALHLQFISVAAGEQSLEWLNGISVATRTKFEKM